VTGAAGRSGRGGVWRFLLFAAGLIMAPLNAVALYFIGAWSSVPAHAATPDAAGSDGGLPFFLALAAGVIAAAAAIVAWVTGRRTLAATLAAVQFIPLLLILIWIATPSF
jgi:hypothetical protein